MVPFLPQPGVVDAIVVRGALAPPLSVPDLLIEVPHGATCTADFTALEARLRSPLPEGLVDFFHVNTDAGAPELAEAIARRFVTSEPRRAVAILRCRIPRTFIDCNRRIDADPSDFRAGKVTPGLMPWITAPEDRALLRGLYDLYVASVRTAADAVMARGGAMFMLHTYAPRSVDVEVDSDIVQNLHRAYESEVYASWPERPPLDVIARGTDGSSYAPEPVVQALRENVAPLGLTVTESATYPMHPSTMAWHFAHQWRGRTLCLEVRRDLLADPFEPFVEMSIGAEKVRILAGPIADALRRWWP
jgi:hypothetical protein